MRADTEADLAKACLAVLINLSIALNQKHPGAANRRDSPQQQRQQQQNAQEDPDAVNYEARVFAANSVVQVLAEGEPHLSAELQFQLCCVLGTLVFRQAEAIDIVAALEADAVLRRIAADRAGEPAAACAAELLKALENPEQ